MTEYIDKEAIRNMLYWEDALTMRGVKLINQFPAADVKPVARGAWVEVKTGFHCSVCKKKAAGTSKGALLSNFCPNCGADMREVEK